jgi:uncharacterized protein YndB with AHSA1/START domain
MKLTEITVTHTIPATPEKIYDVWLNPKSPGGPWFGSERCIINPVVDGLFYNLVKHENRLWPHFGRFTVLEHPHKIEHTWMSEATKGAESVVSITLEPRGDDTEFTLRHSGVPDDEMGHRHKDGWNWVLSMLAQGMAAKRSAT